ncbi:flagellar basal body rod protein FlgB [Clostridium thermobutyricum]|uniref:flagellar basal body rod protein FlgB n=1 Tax=Clostridium thermobutyricum TaxID=29372 RepID=UPI002943E1DF|nr:flagellar basal body rod protein FlgB [Clostridium thermobutyricum]
MTIKAINSSDSYSLLKEGLKASSLRGKAIANNIANINTKNYKRDTVVFEENLNKAINDFKLKKTNSKHLENGENLGNITLAKDTSTSMRSDGNNVDLDIEKTNQAANTLKFNALVQQASGKLNNISYVIRGGR